MALTIGQTIDQLHAALCEYIESTYHISDQTLIDQRQRLLMERGVIHQQPYLESTPRYKPGQEFAALNLPEACLELFERLSKADDDHKKVLHNPPWEHQAAALRNALVETKSLLVTTGTGSGKTECFLLPILGKLAREAHRTRDRFGQRAGTRALILYPMNALVNDQLGRLRLLFGDQRVVKQFMAWSGRAARFARYTSRTLYPGVRLPNKDSQRLQVINQFYINYLQRAAGEHSDDQALAAELVRTLQDKGKWPAKHDLEAWFGRPRTRWCDAQGHFQRCVTFPEDAELFTRHEVQAAPPDVLVTNYSMLEYMLMRPLERPIFEQTAAWLRENPDEQFLLVIDEAHLYRGAAGAEVALLIRRLRDRLQIPSDRLQVICTSASFECPEEGIKFAAQLSGKQSTDFAPPITGTLDKRLEASGDHEDAQLFANIDLSRFYEAESDVERHQVLEPFLQAKGIRQSKGPLEKVIYEALHDYKPLGKLINSTMDTALPIAELGRLLFPDTQIATDTADRAVTNLIALGSFARRSAMEPGLLPCRVHAFYRGLAGLWICMDPHCINLPESQRGTSPGGKLYSQPYDLCTCGARVLELFTCRHCGTAYARAYTDNIDEPDYLWAEPGSAFRTMGREVEELKPLDLLIEGEPVVGNGEPHSYDLITGQLDPIKPSSRARSVFIRSNRESREDNDETRPTSEPGQYRPCAVCGQSYAFGRASVQDHQTKGDQPFQALVTKQIQVQAPSAKRSSFAPLRGRKALVFSDSRQAAARLAPNLQKYSMQDVMRPLIMRGFTRLQQSPILGANLNLSDTYLGVLLAAADLDIRLRPALMDHETFAEAREVRDSVEPGITPSDQDLFRLQRRVQQSCPPASIQQAILTCIKDKYYGLESLALASIVEGAERTEELTGLPDIPEIAESIQQKQALVRLWLGTWVSKKGYWLPQSMPDSWHRTVIKPGSGKFRLISRFLGSTAANRIFERQWLPVLLGLFTERTTGRNQHLLRGGVLTLKMEGEWAYCNTCKTTQRPFPDRQQCVNCGQNSVCIIDPDTDLVFSTRKGFYRHSAIDALQEGRSPMALIAAEHTAQLNASQPSEVFSKAEEYELLFQDVDLGRDEAGHDRIAIDILSCTTTMEVGIDIGSLSGVALRNMPPARANYQQRAGRAGRRGSSIATVTSFGSADSHDEHFFSYPDLMIRGPVDDPFITVNNEDIAFRHVTAYLFQRYHQARLGDNGPGQNVQLFEVLGTVSEFQQRESILNRWDFIRWLQSNETELKRDISTWLPEELNTGSVLEDLPNQLTEVLAVALGEAPTQIDTPEGDSDASVEVGSEVDEERPPVRPDNENLLDRLLYKGVLPRYAFPTDVATFHVFHPDSNEYYPQFRYTPSQSLSVALTQYAPGKEVWIDNKLWHSGAIYSTMRDELYRAWCQRQLYFECEICHYSKIEPFSTERRGEMLTCDACGAPDRLGPGRTWFRPPGFAHRVERAESTTPDDQPARSFATRAKLMAPTPPESAAWIRVNDRIHTHGLRKHLLVTNRGPRSEGYNYCVKCGLIDPAVGADSSVFSDHRKPYPTIRDHVCTDGRPTRGIVLGTDYPSDILLISLRVDDPVRLWPGDLATKVALRTVSEALSAAACRILGIEATEIDAEYRPSVSDNGRRGYVAEIFLYDTLPGGAGFSQRAGQSSISVMEKALELLEKCPEDCDRSCYRCLRSYKNKFEHDLLDRHLGESLLRYLLYGTEPTLNTFRLEQAGELLYEDIKRQSGDEVCIEKNVILSKSPERKVIAPIMITNQKNRFVVGIRNPLTPGVFADNALQIWAQSTSEIKAIGANELIVRRNLPHATRAVLSEISE